MPDLRPLFTVLGDLALVRPGLVLMQGRRYWPIARLVAQARRDLGVPSLERALRSPSYWWDEDADDKVVVWRSVRGSKEAIFAEPGSDVRTA